MKKIEVTMDVITGKETTIERDETPDEKLIREQLEQEVILIAEKKSKIEAIYEKLGLTPDEIKLLTSR
jgi:hypothetical protein